MASGFLLDSNICIYLLEDVSPRLSARARSQSLGSLFVSAISLAEISFGLGEQINRLAGFLEDVVIVDFDEAAARFYATIPFKRARFDRLIAAHALSLGLTLVTNNERDFADIPGLEIENWTL